MFNISKLIIYDANDYAYTYNFAEGLNYFKGKNSSGKTEFYLFLDYMFGSSDNIAKRPWYKDCLSKATMYFEYNNTAFIITRTKDPERNYLCYADEEISEVIDLRQYKDKLNSIFAQDIQLLRNIRDFTNEELSYRSFTMFNFLGEKGQGKIQDFLDKCSNIKYSVKLNPILNFIFNNNLEKIYELQRELDSLLQEVKELEYNVQKQGFVINQVNENLQKIDGNILYNGKNPDEISARLTAIKEMRNEDQKVERRNIADLEVMYNNLSEQIKVYENNAADAKQFENDNENRRKLLFKLQELVDDNSDFNYLVQPIQTLLNDIDNSIFFSNYIISDNTVKELKKQRDQIKTEIRRNDSRFKCYNLEQKSKAIALIEEYLTIELICSEDILKEKKKRIREIRDELKALQNSDDTKKINELSDFITELYCSAKDTSSVVSDDLQQYGFKIKYLKKGNILQPTIFTKADEESDSGKQTNYYIGSMARHTLIQLCGYLSFFKILLENSRYPVIPILVIDHISKPFDEKNSSAIGAVISKAYKTIGKENLQIFIFDDEDYEKLQLQPDHAENLVTDTKTGFSPFFFPPATDSRTN